MSVAANLNFPIGGVEKIATPLMMSKVERSSQIQTITESSQNPEVKLLLSTVAHLNSSGGWIAESDSVRHLEGIDVAQTINSLQPKSLIILDSSQGEIQINNTITMKDGQTITGYSGEVDAMIGSVIFRGIAQQAESKALSKPAITIPTSFATLFQNNQSVIEMADNASVMGISIAVDGAFNIPDGNHGALIQAKGKQNFVIAGNDLSVNNTDGGKHLMLINLQDSEHGLIDGNNMNARVTIMSAAPVRVYNSLFIQYVNNKIEADIPSSCCSFAAYGGGGLHTFVGNSINCSDGSQAFHAADIGEIILDKNDIDVGKKVFLENVKKITLSENHIRGGLDVFEGRDQSGDTMIMTVNSNTFKSDSEIALNPSRHFLIKSDDNNRKEGSFRCDFNDVVDGYISFVDGSKCPSQSNPGIKDLRAIMGKYITNYRRAGTDNITEKATTEGSVTEEVKKTTDSSQDKTELNT